MKRALFLWSNRNVSSLQRQAKQDTSEGKKAAGQSDRLHVRVVVSLPNRGLRSNWYQLQLSFARRGRGFRHRSGHVHVRLHFSVLSRSVKRVAVSDLLFEGVSGRLISPELILKLFYLRKCWVLIVVTLNRRLGLEVNTEKTTRCLFMSPHQSTRQNYDWNVANKYFGNVVKFKYLGMIVKNQNCIHKEIKSRPNSGNACYHAVQNLLSSLLLPKSLKYTKLILPVVLYWCGTWSLI
jgi:hypothetical protein